MNLTDQNSIEKCEKDIVAIKTTGLVVSAIFTAVGSWFGLQMQ
jgi:hypothetical protein